MPALNFEYILAYKMFSSVLRRKYSVTIKHSGAGNYLMTVRDNLISCLSSCIMATRFSYPTAKHNWGTLVKAIQAHIGSLNWGYRVALREKKVKCPSS